MYNEQSSEQALLHWKVLSLILSVAITWQIANKGNIPTDRPLTIAPTVVSPVVEEQVKPATKPRFLSVVDTKEKISYNDKDFFCMAKNIYHEAKGEPDLGKYAVAQVTVNRAKHSKYPDGICEVVLQPKQFSWANDSSVRWATPRGPAWEHSKKVAHDVLAEGKRVHGLDRALFFHADYVRPNWANQKRKLAKIGAHIFYGLRGKA